MTRDLNAQGEDARDVGQSQSLFREVNERIEELETSFGIVDEMPILCECASTDCTERIALTLAEYEQLRGIPTHFAVLPGHEILDVERVVEQRAHYVVVEKFGESAAAAIKLDPRRRDR